MSAPFAGVPALPFNTAHAADPNKSESSSGENLDDALAKLNPPRKQYRTYYSSREANLDMIRAPQGLRAFLRAYYHMKSADWTPNKPVRPTSRTAGEFAKLPTYYVMELNKNMPDTVAPAMPSASEIAACRWLPDSELSVYVGEYQRTHFQGGLNGYRVRLTAAHNAELQLFSNRTVDVPSMWSIQGSCSSRIAFDAPEQSGRSDIWVISSAGGQPRQLTKGPATNAVPSFSPDGKWIYFRSVSAGRANIWRVPFQGGSAEQVTRNGGFVSFLSTDSKTLYYTKGAGIAEPLYAAWTVDAWPRLWMVASSTARNSVRVLMSDLEDLHS